MKNNLIISMAPTAFSILHYLPFFLLSIQIFNSNAQTNQMINLGSSLIASDSSSSSSWQSPSSDFAFGFRQTENHNLFLLAIWFDKIPDKTIVWYANGDNLAPKGSKIELTNDGQFRLNDPQGQSLWEAETSTRKADYIMLLDTGNLVLGANNSGYIWKSFDHPTDTLLPSQVLEFGGVIFSRETNRKYSKGRFQLRLVPEGNIVLETIAFPRDFSYGSYYSTTTSDNLNTTNSGYRLVFNETGYLYVLLRNGMQANLTKGNISPSNFYYRATLDSDGIFAQYAHSKTPRNGSSYWEESWFTVWYVPEDICFAFTGDFGSGACGFNSFCAPDSYGRPTCTCLPGFSLVDSSNQYSGCKQDKVQKCEVHGLNLDEVYDMAPVSNVYWPTSSNYERFPLRNEEDCRTSCLSDCNCVVAVIKEGYCWKKKLPISNGRIERNIYGKSLVKILKIDGSGGHSDPGKKNQETLVLVFSILLGGSFFVNLLFIGGISLVFFFVYRKRQKLDTNSSLLEMNLRFFTYAELKDATDGFKEEVGRGAFGTVYKGVLFFTTSTSTSRKTVAVKKLERLAQESEKEFKTEASAIAQTHHKNLVRLLGFCVEGTHRLLVYEFMTNGTLANFAFGISRPDWNKRIQMALGIARGLVYLHEECSTQIIHCDIKPQNILLDDTFTAKISDFGLAKLLMSDQTRTNTGIRGTKGYVAPEWFRSTPVTAKVDVYSYGVLLLEIVCCRKNVEQGYEDEDKMILTDWVYDCYKSRMIEKVLEDDDEARTDMKTVERLVMVAIWCIQEDPSLRPSMKKVLQMLEGVVEVSNPPCPSPFTSIY